MQRMVFVSVVSLVLAAAAAAQVNQQWVTFAANPARLDMASTALSSTTTEASFAVGDLDRDGWLDVVAAREEPASPGGKRPNMLLRNDAGVLRDETVLYAALSDVAGDLGFLTPAGDRDVELGDVDGDGWLDAVFARTLHDGDPKGKSHPRVYHNLGEATGAWLGLGHEDARIPQLYTLGGLAVAPRFVAVALGDIDNDADLDLHFVDQDGVGVGGLPPEPSANDLNDRLLVNDGAGFYTDESFARMTTTQLDAFYGIDTRIVDLNGDGAAEITHLTANGDPTGVFTEYNDAAHLGYFQALGQQSIGPSSPYAMDIGELNNDGKPDIVVEDDSLDRYRLNQGVDALGKVLWGPLKTFSFAGGTDDGFGGNTRITDLDGDAWKDVLIASHDIDIVSCSGRLHIYRNLGGVPGADVTLEEEAEFNNGNMGTGWKGVVGMQVMDLNGTYDVAPGDFDNDGDTDLLVARCTGSFFWENGTNPAISVCQENLGFAGPGAMTLDICGDPLEFEGAEATLALNGAAPLQPVFLPLGLSASPTPFKGGTLVPVPPAVVVVGPLTDAGGALSMPVSALGGSLATIYLQALVKDGATWELSNALELVIGV